MQLKLTLKQRKFLKKYMETGNATESAMQVYDCKERNTANTIGSENLAKLGELTIQELMEEAGLDDTSLLGTLKENLSATRLFGKEAVEWGDYGARNKALEIALRLKGQLSNQIDLTSKGKEIKFEVVRGND